MMAVMMVVMRGGMMARTQRARACSSTEWSPTCHASVYKRANVDPCMTACRPHNMLPSCSWWPSLRHLPHHSQRAAMRQPSAAAAPSRTSLECLAGQKCSKER